MVKTPERRRRLLVKMFHQQEGKCYWCGCQMILPVRNAKTEPNTATREHLVPIKYGGTMAQTNLRAACRKCNNERGCKRHMTRTLR